MLQELGAGGEERAARDVGGAVEDLEGGELGGLGQSLGGGARDIKRHGGRTLAVEDEVFAAFGEALGDDGAGQLVEHLGRAGKDDAPGGVAAGIEVETRLRSAGRSGGTRIARLTRRGRSLRPR